MRPGKNNRSGFTLIELLVVSSMTVILAGVGVSSYINQQRYSVLKNTAEEVVAYLNNARQRSISQEESSNWGMRFNNSQTEVDSYALFVGATYSSAREQRYFPSFLEFTNPLLNESTDIIFAKITGKTIDGLSKVVTFKISGTEIYAMVNVTGEGLISYTIPGGTIEPPDAPDMNCGGEDQHVHLSWPKPNENGSSIISYRVYRGLSSGGETLLASINAPASSPITYIDLNLTNGTNYYYQVSAINAIGESQRSIERMCTPSTSPGGPTDLTASPDDRQCNLLWKPPLTDNGSPITGYKVYRGTAPNPTTLVQTLGNVLNYSDPVLINGTTYYYRLKAVNVIGESVNYSNEITCVPILLPPTNLTATYGDQQCTLSWTASTSLPANIAGYNLYRNTVSPPTTKILPELGNITSHIDPGLTNGTTYYYCVKTRNTASNESVCSNIISCQPKTVPGSPTGLTATGTITSVTLNWTAPSDTGGVPLTAYKLFRDMTSPAVTLFKTLGIVTSYIDTEVAAGNIYYYRVKAVNSVTIPPGDSAFSNEATGSTFCANPCAETVYGSWSSCGGYSSTCDESGTRSRSVTTYNCQDQQCVSSVGTESQDCTRYTDGDLCNTGSWSSCSYSSTCAESGTQSRSVTYCSNGSCSTPDTQSQTCVRDTDGTLCQSASGECDLADYCVNGSCPANCNSGASCGSTTYVCSGDNVYTRTFKCNGCSCSTTTDTWLATCGDYYACVGATRYFHDRSCVSGSSTCADSVTNLGCSTACVSCCTASDCGTNGWECSGSQKCYRTYTCSSNSCSSSLGSCTDCTCGCTSGSCNTVYSCGRCSDTSACQYANFNCCGSCSCSSPFNVSYTLNTGCTGVCVTQCSPLGASCTAGGGCLCQ